MAYIPPPSMMNMLASDTIPNATAHIPAVAAADVAPDREMNKIHISPIAEGVDEESLKMVFSACGTIVKVTIFRKNDSTRYGFIEFTDSDAARTAVQMSGVFIGGVSVKVANSKAQKPIPVDSLGLRPSQKTGTALENENQYTKQLYDTSNAYLKWQEEERERKAKQIQRDIIEKKKQQKRDQKRREREEREEREAFSDGSFDSAMSTEELKRRKKANRRGSSSSSSDSSTSTMPSPPRIAYQGPPA
eukprot:TRINITY_DN19687_c0_g1_i1.p1 TRINITY_DN19687_c0_g1~~TRINITY_DN19687_c0_g1_i1.p1  ORF type:complete len:247 (+),score=59.06 TRINITY_DN19687_c0_g1_i1:63-803(+)